MHVRDALTFAARLFRSGHRSDEAEALITLTREHYRLLDEIERHREQTRAWRWIAVDLFGLARTLRDILTDRQKPPALFAREQPGNQHETDARFRPIVRKKESHRSDLER